MELHRRLLQQINKDCHSIHHLFFELEVPERMSVIAMDHEIRRREGEREARPGQRRVSAATMARLEERERIRTLEVRFKVWDVHRCTCFHLRTVIIQT